MESTFLHKVYTIINGFMHHHEFGSSSSEHFSMARSKACPVTGLDISMQPRNSKFISPLGVQWYFTHHMKQFKQKLLPFLHHKDKNKPLDQQFVEIAHNIRNADSNPRNNTRRAIKRILDDKNCLFNNRELIDKRKLKEAGLV